MKTIINQDVKTVFMPIAGVVAGQTTPQYSQPTITDQDFSEYWVAKSTRDKRIRDILEVCRKPSTALVIKTSIAKKNSDWALYDLLKRLVKAGILAKTEHKVVGVRNKLKFTITAVGERTLRQYPGSKPQVQYLLYGFDRDV